MANIERVTNYLKSELNLSENDTAVVRYALEVLFATAVNFLAIIIAAYLLGVLKYALIAALGASSLRIFSGGAHSVKHLNCALLGVIISPSIGLLAKYVVPGISDWVMTVLVVTVFIIGITAVLRYAPSDNPKKPITRQTQKKKLRFLSILYMLIWGVAGVLTLTGVMPIQRQSLVAFTLGLFWQIFTITPLGYRFSTKIDRFLP